MDIGAVSVLRTWVLSMGRREFQVYETQNYYSEMGGMETGKNKKLTKKVIKESKSSKSN